MLGTAGLSVLGRYGTAIALTAIALLAALVLHPQIEISPFPLLLTAVMLSAWYGGRWAGLLATALSTLAINYFFETPIYSLVIVSLDTVVKLLVFALTAVLISGLMERLRDARAQAAQARAEALAAHHHAEQVLERITEGFLELDRDGRILYINQQALQLLLPDTSHTRNTELMGRSIWDVLPLRSGVQWEDAYRKAISERTTITFEEYYPRFQRWVEFTIYPDEERASVFCRESRHTWTEPLGDGSPRQASADHDVQHGDPTSSHG